MNRTLFWPLLFLLFALGCSRGHPRLVLAMNQHMETDAVRRQIPAFERASGIRVEIQSLPENELHQRTLIDLTSRRGGFDVVMMDFMFTPQYARARLIEPLDEHLNEPELDVADFLPALMNATRYQGRTWAIPFTSESTLLFYRKDLLEQAGIAPPRTYDDLADAARKLHKLPERAGIGLRGERGQGMNVYVWTGFLRGFGGSFFRDLPRDMTPTFGSAEAVRATETYARLLRESGPTGAANWTWMETLQAMQDGRIALCVDASNFGPAIEDPARSRTAGRWGFALPPGGSGGIHPAIYTHTLAINASSKKKREAWQFIRWATSRAAQRERAMTTGEPTRTSIWRDPEFRQAMHRVGGGQWVETSLLALSAAHADYRPSFEHWREVGDLVGIAVQSVIAGQKSAEEALGEARRATIDLLRRNRYPLRTLRE